MSWGYVAVAAATVVGGYLSSEGSKKGAQKGVSAQDRARLEYQAYNQPYYDAGTSAVDRLARLNAGDFTGFEASPDYQFSLDQGNEALTRAAASRGSLNSGGTDVDLLTFGQGLASQNYGTYYNRLAQLAGMGQSAAQGLGGSASNAANNIGQIQAGNAANQGAIWGSTIGQLGGLYGQYLGNQSTYQRPVYQGQGAVGNFGSEQLQQPSGGYNFGG